MSKNEFILLTLCSATVFALFTVFCVKIGCPLSAGWLVLMLGVSVIIAAAMIHNAERRS